MINLTRILGWLYAQSLKFYPPGFRNKFSVEMKQVLLSAVEETKKNYALKLLDFSGAKYVIGLVRSGENTFDPGKD